jgi:dTMP kinase
VTGYTIVGLEVDDDTRGRTFAFLQSALRVILFAVIIVAPFMTAGLSAAVRGISGSATVRIGNVDYADVGINLVLLLAAAVALVQGVVSYRQMDDRRGVPLLSDLNSVFRGEPFAPLPVYANGHRAAARRGLLLALEGGEGAGKSTQARLLAIWLRDQGYDVVATHEPGATKVGMRLRALLLDTTHTGLSPRSETLMYAADRAEHVASVIGPALERGAIVVTDRYVDSSLAYQGAGRLLPVSEVETLNQWATGGLMPDLTIVLDLPPAAGLQRRERSGDRLEAEPAEFHERVRSGFLALSAAEPERYLLLDATRPSTEISREIQSRVRDLLPDPVPMIAEATTGSFPAVRD